MQVMDPSWLAANHRYLTCAIRVTEARLEAAVRRAADGGADDALVGRAVAELQAAAAAMPAPPALERVVELFGLSPFQRELLLLAAAVELSSVVGQRCATLLGDPRRAIATFGLGLAVLPGAHWSALAPGSALRRWRLIEVEPGPLTTASLRIDERILHELAGVDEPDERLRAVLRAEVAAPSAYAGAVGELTRCLRSDARPVMVVVGGTAASRLGVASAGLAAAGWPPLRAVIPEVVPDRQLLVTLLEREAILRGAGLVIEHGADTPDRLAITHELVDAVWPLVIASGTAFVVARPSVQLALPPIDAAGRRRLWHEALGPAAAAVGPVLDELITEFRVAPEDIARFGNDWRCRVAAGEVAPPDAEHPLRARLRAENRAHFAGLAQVIVPSADGADLVLPEAQAELIAQIELHVRHRDQVLDDWGFGRRDSRGLGIAALFHGPSGTGKTLAAEVIARRLGFDLVRVDLSQVVSKYIGETEKNLGRIFDAADRGACVLLFDEADALFGKRSEVKDSHDRYANIEVGYLLQRIEAFRGLAVLTTNLKQALDPAFMRRLRFVVAFPFPDAGERRRIWERVLPPQLPRGELDLDRVARLQVAGGNIRNIALHAAFLAAAERAPIAMRHLLRASRDECARIEKSVTSAELGGWQ